MADVHLIRTTLIPPAPENAIVVQHIDSNGVDRHYSQELSGETFNHVGANGYLPINYTCNQTPDLWSIFSIFQSEKKMKVKHSFISKMSLYCKATIQMYCDANASVLLILLES